MLSIFRLTSFHAHNNESSKHVIHLGRKKKKEREGTGWALLRMGEGEERIEKKGRMRKIDNSLLREVTFPHPQKCKIKKKKKKRRGGEKRRRGGGERGRVRMRLKSGSLTYSPAFSQGGNGKKGGKQGKKEETNPKREGGGGNNLLHKYNS